MIRPLASPNHKVQQVQLTNKANLHQQKRCTQFIASESQLYVIIQKVQGSILVLTNRVKPNGFNKRDFDWAFPAGFAPVTGGNPLVAVRPSPFLGFCLKVLTTDVKCRLLDTRRRIFGLNLCKADIFHTRKLSTLKFK